MVQSRQFNKIFCIGMNKTGTSSIHAAFLELDLKSLHHGHAECSTLKEHLASAQSLANMILDNHKSGKKLLKHINEYDAYSDIGPVINKFDILDHQYPNSKFIYTDRDTEEWIDSRRRHVLRNLANEDKGLYKSDFSQIEEEKWRKRKSIHLNKVKKHFENRPESLLFIRITEGEGFEKLCPFLGFECINKPFPKKNIV